MTILEKMLENCEKAGYATTKNVQKIANAKQMMFGEAEWQNVLVTDRILLAIVFLKHAVRTLNAMASVIVTAIAKKLPENKTSKKDFQEESLFFYLKFTKKN